jgi:hypothetical protein
VLRATLLETPAAAQAREPAQRRNATPGLTGNERNAEHRIADHDGAQPPPPNAKHSHENLTGSPAASGRTARPSNGEEGELAPRLSTQMCEPPNVGHERRLEACEARWKTSARWKG